MLSLHVLSDLLRHPTAAPSRLPRRWQVRRRWLRLPSARTAFRAVVVGSLIAAAVLTWFLRASAHLVPYLPPGG